MFYSLTRKAIQTARRLGLERIVHKLTTRAAPKHLTSLLDQGDFASNSLEPPAFELALESALRSQKLPLSLPGMCNVCGAHRGFRLASYNFREDLKCWHCSVPNRKRQLAAIVSVEFGGRKSDVLTENLHRLPQAVWLMEKSDFSSQLLPRGVIESEYFGSGHISGSAVNGVRHEDVLCPSFSHGSLELVISSEVFEHVPNPYMAHQKVWDCLAYGGKHIFSVPFLQDADEDQVKATMDGGAVIHHMEPEYHGDPLRPGGVLVFTLFSKQMLPRLEAIGFKVSVYRLRQASLGILGENGLVFVAEKTR